MAAADTLPSPNASRIDWRGLGWAFLFFWYFSGVVHVMLQMNGATTSFGLRQATIASLLWLIPLILVPQRARQLAAGIGIMLWVFSLFSLGYFAIYGQEFSQSVIFIMFESNLAESSEYFAQYFAWWMVPVYLAYTFVAWLLWKRVRPLNFARTPAVILSLALFVGLLVYPLTAQILKRPTLQMALE